MYNTENNSVVLQDHHSIYLHITEGIHLKNTLFKGTVHNKFFSVFALKEKLKHGLFLRPKWTSRKQNWFRGVHYSSQINILP